MQFRYPNEIMLTRTRMLIIGLGLIMVMNALAYGGKLRL